MLKSPHYIEDWILLLNGQLDSQLNPMTGHYSNGPVRLATYDAKFVESVSISILNGSGLSDRQLATARKVVGKYQRQLATRGYDNSTVQVAPHRLPLRVVDRSSWVELDTQTQQYRFRFPYQGELVGFLHEQSMSALGKFSWNSNQRIWEVDANEHNLMLLMRFMLHSKNTYSWKFCSKSQIHFDTVADAVENPTHYLAHIDLCDDQLVLQNASAALQQALIHDGFAPDGDPVQWALRSHKYGIHTGANLQQYLHQQHPLIANIILTNKTQAQSDHIKYNGIQYNTLFEMMKIFSEQPWIFIVDTKTFDKNGMFSKFIESLGVSKNIKVLSYHNWNCDDIVNFVDISESIVVTNVSELMYRGKLTEWHFLSKRCMKYLFCFSENK